MNETWKIEAIKMLALMQGLKNANALWNASAASTCNGIGAEWFPEWLRWAVTSLHPTLEPTSWIHDMGYSKGGGILDRLNADLTFLSNGFRAAYHTYSCIHLARYIVMAQAVLFFVLLRIGGQAAFNWTGDRKA